VARLILDTSVLIAGVRSDTDLGRLANADDIAVPGVVVAEYVAGVLLDGDPGRAAAQRSFLDEVLEVVPVAGYDRAVAEHHAVLLAHTRRNGGQRGVHDLIVAATARASQRTILTADARARFDELPGVTAQLL
jgi:tRNA(fMet)-specific endonuclease VapC